MLSESELQKLDSNGWVQIHIAELWKSLLQNVLELLEKKKFRAAHINLGTVSTSQENKIRNDHIHWIDSEKPVNQAEAQWTTVITELQEDLKNYFRISLCEKECHYAVYNEGHFYTRHSDQSSANNKRYFSFVYYLNENWHTNDGGQLVIYHENNPALELTQITPVAGTLILFKSHIEHEVLPSFKKRFSVTGWMRTT